MCWSKNILEEQSDPSQIILGARDPTFCMILSLAIHFKFGLLLGNVLADTRLLACSKSRISDLLRKVVNHKFFCLFWVKVLWARITFVGFQKTIRTITGAIGMMWRRGGDGRVGRGLSTPTSALLYHILMQS